MGQNRPFHEPDILPLHTIPRSSERSSVGLHQISGRDKQPTEGLLYTPLYITRI